MAMPPKLDQKQIERYIRDIPEVVERLTDLLIKENAALKAFKPEDFKDELETKGKLAKLYERQMMLIARQPELLTIVATEKEDRTALKEKVDLLEKEIKKNDSLLRANIQGSKNYLDIVLKATRRERQKNATYGAHGAFREGKEAGLSTAISYDQTL